MAGHLCISHEGCCPGSPNDKWEVLTLVAIDLRLTMCHWLEKILICSTYICRGKEKVWPSYPNIASSFIIIIIIIIFFFFFFFFFFFYINYNIPNFIVLLPLQSWRVPKGINLCRLVPLYLNNCATFQSFRLGQILFCRKEKGWVKLILKLYEYLVARGYVA